MSGELQVGCWLRLPKASFDPANLINKLRLAVQVSDMTPAERGVLVNLYEEDRDHLYVPRQSGFLPQSVVLSATDCTLPGDPRSLGEPFTLRPYQPPIVDEFMRRLATDYPYGGQLCAAAGAGKTVMALEVLRRLGRTTLVLVHKEFLMRQWRERIEQFLPNIRVGYVQQDQCDYGDKFDVVLGMIQSLAQRAYSDALYRWPGVVVSDECFPGATEILLANGRRSRLDAVLVGQAVKNAIGVGRVSSIFSRTVPIAATRLLRFEDGSEYICTEKHPLLRFDGWISAAAVQPGDHLWTRSGCIGIMRTYGTETSNSVDMRKLRNPEVGADRASVLLALMHGDCQTEAGISAVRGMQDRAGEAESESFLFSVLSAESTPPVADGKCSCAFREGDSVASGQPGGCGGFCCSDAAVESDEERGREAEAIGDVAEDRSQTSCPRRERVGAHGSATAATRRTGGGLGGGEGDPSPLDPLHAGLGAYGKEDCGGGGWQFAPEPSAAGVGCAQDGSPRILGVASVTVPKREDFDRLGFGLEGDRVRVWNLSVTGHPSYTLGNGLVVHNCHRLGAETWSNVIAKFPAKIRIGLTATPRRKDGMEPVFFWHIGPILAQAKRSETRTMPPAVKVVSYPERYNLGRYMMRNGKFNVSRWITDITQNQQRNAVIVRLLQQALERGRKVIVLSDRLDHLSALHQSVKAASPQTVVDYYVGGMAEEALERSEDAQLLLATYAMAAEGLDIPALDALFLVTPKSDVEQAVGRIQRYVEGKKQPIVVDVVDTSVGLAMALAEKRRRVYSRLHATMLP